MPGRYVALVSNDPALTDEVQRHLKKKLGQRLWCCPWDSLPTCLGPESDGVLLLAASSAEERERVVRLVQRVRLEQWPVLVAVLSRDGAVDQGAWARVEPYVAGRFHWPAQSPALLDFLRRNLPRGKGFQPVDQDSLQDKIARRLLCHTPSLLPLVEPLALAASHDVTVALTGETGTGKTYLVRLIHDCSPRQRHRLLVVPCGALAPNLVESEFFGHVKGAFTGADRAKVGKFEAAGEGTLLLDEIDTLGLEQQANLLRVIETGQYEPVGSNTTQICRARIIVASNLDLEEALANGRFRQDLYYRLHVMAFHLPPLRERIQDIVPLTQWMTARFNDKFGKGLFDISSEALSALEAFPWPGNIRQLENVVQQSVLVSSGPVLLLRDLPKPLQEYAACERSHDSGEATDSLLYKRRMLERTVIHRALVSCGYNRARAAYALGISRVTLYKKMKKYDLMTMPQQPTSDA